MKNRISMALKNPILQQGFEIICKNLVELEKENAELKTDYKVLSCSVDDFGKLQDKLEEEQRKNNGLSENLTKAKEIIKKYLAIGVGGKITQNYLDVTKEAEQFIKDSEVEK